MAWSFQGNHPVYLQIASRIRSDIIRGKYSCDQQIPPVRQLAFEAAVNPNTMQRALMQLEQEGLLVSKGTVGRFVTEDAAVLDDARRKAAVELIDSLLIGCKQMGFQKKEIIQMLNETEDTEECQY
ncbi:MAG: GntR family transcriptional regulator [Clostridia bacterium]|nr:GntR family transcriptional regulator [Clostridia bacterium]